MRKRFVRKNEFSQREVLQYQLLNSVTSYPRELMFSEISFRNLILRAFRSNRWEVALVCGCEKIYEKLLPANDLSHLIASFRVGLNSQYPHVLDYLKKKYLLLNEQEKSLILQDLLNLDSYNWNNLVIFTAYFDLSIIYRKQLTIRAAILCQNSWYFSLLHPSFLTPNLRKFVIMRNADSIYRNFSTPKNLLYDWSLAVKYRAYRILDVLQIMAYREERKITEKRFRDAIYRANFSTHRLEMFFLLGKENQRVVETYKLSEIPIVRLREQRFLRSFLFKLKEQQLYRISA